MNPVARSFSVIGFLVFAGMLHEPAYAPLVKRLGWSEKEVERLYPRLICLWEQTISCSLPAKCSPPIDVTGTPLGIEIDFLRRDFRFSARDERLPFTLESSTISETGFDGDLDLKSSAGHIVVRIHKPGATSTPIQYALTDDRQGKLEIHLGICVRP